MRLAGRDVNVAAVGTGTDEVGKDHGAIGSSGAVGIDQGELVGQSLAAWRTACMNKRRNKAEVYGVASRVLHLESDIFVVPYFVRSYRKKLLTIM